PSATWPTADDTQIKINGAEADATKPAVAETAVANTPPATAGTNDAPVAAVAPPPEKVAPTATAEPAKTAAAVIPPSTGTPPVIKLPPEKVPPLVAAPEKEPAKIATVTPP